MHLAVVLLTKSVFLLAGEKCLIKAVDSIVNSKWDDAFKHLKCATSKE